MLRLFRRSLPARDTSHVDVAHGGESYRVALKRVSGATRFTLRVRSATRDVVLTMPPRSSLTSAKEFAERHAAWIGARLKRLPKPVPFADGEIIPYQAKPHRIVHVKEARGTVWIEETPEGESLIYVAGAQSHVARRVSDFLKRQARKKFEEAVRHHCKTLDIAARKVTVRDTTSRWGSCSASGALNFSWRLIMAPPDVLDYLAAHEVAHLIHLNHSDKFWKVTRKLSAHTDMAEAWLRANGADLHRYGHQGEDDSAAD
jgi:predicted metal-dependent hydrolase